MLSSFISSVIRASSVLSIIVDRTSMSEPADSCLGSGKDRIYTYSNLILRTYYEDGKDTLQEINITGAGVKIPSGIEVGMKTGEITAKHGAPASDGEYIYDTAYGTVEYRCTGDKIDEIWIY